MTQMKEFSLWIVPPEHIYDKFFGIISRISEQYFTPVFEPHVTLLGNLVESEENISVKTSELANFIRPFKIELTTVSYFDEYFRCLFIKVNKTKGIMDANLKAREIFDREQDEEFIPHLSLMYGNFDPQMKEKIISEIGDNINVEFEVRDFYLVSSSSNIDPKDWHRLKKFML